MTHPQAARGRRTRRWSDTALPGVVALALGLVACSFSGSRPEAEPDAGSDGVSAAESADPTVEVVAQGAPDAAEPQDGPRIDVLLADAAAAEAAGELRRAHALYAQAMEVDPGNPDARDGFARVGAVLGVRAPAAGAAGAEDVAETAAEMTAVRRAQSRIEAETNVQLGEAALQAGDYERAVQLFSRALDIVRWNPFLEEGRAGVLTEESLLARIEDARRGQIEREREAEQTRQALIVREQQEAEEQERARLEFRITRLAEAANLSFQDNRFGEAESYLNEILRLDPTNQRALRLRDMTRDAALQDREREIKDTYKRNWRQVFDEMAADLRPQNDLVVFPDEGVWRDIASQGPLEFTVQDELMSPEERAIREKLATVPMRLEFNETSLSEVIDWFRTVTGVNFIVSPAIIEAGDEPIFTLTAGPMPAIQALELLLRLSAPPLTYRIRNGVVNIVSAEEAVGGQILEIYDIRDLAKVITNFPSRDFNLKPSGFDDSFFGEEGPEPQPLVLEADRLRDLIQTNIAPESWDLDPNNTITAVSGALVVRQNPTVHELIRTLLQDLRENAGTLINIESRFLMVHDTFLEDIGVDFRGLGPDDVNPDADIPTNLVLDDFGSVPDGFGTPAAPSGIGTDNDVGIFHTNGDSDVAARVENLYDVTLGNDEFTNQGGLSLQGTFLNGDTVVEAILRAVSKYGTANVVDAPSLTVFNGQRANLSVINNVSYVKDFDVEIAQAAVIAQPIVDVIQDGVVLDVRPVVSSDKRFITMELRPTIATLQRPIPTFTTTLAIGSPVTIDLPTINIQRARTTVTMPDGATLMIGGWKIIEDSNVDSGIPFLSDVPVLGFFFSRTGKFSEKRKLIVLIRAKIVIPEEGEPVLHSDNPVAVVR